LPPSKEGCTAVITGELVLVEGIRVIGLNSSSRNRDVISLDANPPAGRKKKARKE